MKRGGLGRDEGSIEGNGKESGEERGEGGAET